MSGDTHESVVRYAVSGHIATITLNRPAALNAVNADLSLAAGEALERANADGDVRVVVIAGEGRAFCAGADLRELGAGRSIHAEGHQEWGFAGIAQHWIDKPLIAAVHGSALGGGTEIVLACDLAVMANDAVLGLPEVSRGLLAAGGGLIRAPRQVPLKRALLMTLTGDPIDATTALEWGLVNQVVPSAELMPAVNQLASRIAANAPLAVQRTKRAVHQLATGASDWNLGSSDEDPWKITRRAVREIFATADAKEGARAFAEKRPAVWQGR